jgi:hypothetical protein
MDFFAPSALSTFGTRRVTASRVLAVQRKQKHASAAKLRRITRGAHYVRQAPAIPVPENRPRVRVRCLTRRRVQRLRRVVCTGRASKPDDLRERILPRGGRYVLRLRLQGSAPFIDTRMASCSRRQHLIVAITTSKNNCCLGAAQLTLAPDKTPNSGPAGRAGSFSARRTASRRLQTSPAGCTVSRGKRRAACPLARGCVLRVNRRIVRRTDEGGRIRGIC